MVATAAVNSGVVVLLLNHLEDNCIQNFNLGRYIVRYTAGNIVLRRSASGAHKILNTVILILMTSAVLSRIGALQAT